MRVQSAVIGHPIGASRELPGMVGGKTFRSLAAFETKIGKNGVAILPPGQSVKVFVGQITSGGPMPRLSNLNKDSAFTATFSRGYVTITAKPTARLGKTDNVKFDHGSPVVVNPKPSVKFPFQLQVGIGHIMMG